MNTLLSLEKALLSEVGSFLHRYGFDSKPVGQSFRLAKPYGWASIHLAFVRHPPTDVDVIVNVAIRIDAVQDAIQESDKLITDMDRKNSATVGAELGNLKGAGQQRWTIASAEAIHPVALEILTECEATLLPFIERYSDMDVLLETLTTDAKTASTISPFENKRRKTVLALSKLSE
jgi:hypothetical protein